MRTNKYPSDVTDEQWRLIKQLIPVYPGGRPRSTNLRDVVDAIFYLLRTGCQWRYLPKDFPPKSTVWRYFDQWRHNGTLDTIHEYDASTLSEYGMVVLRDVSYTATQHEMLSKERINKTDFSQDRKSVV